MRSYFLVHLTFKKAIQSLSCFPPIVVNMISRRAILFNLSKTLNSILQPLTVHFLHLLQNIFPSNNQSNYKMVFFKIFFINLNNNSFN